jgi:hypothetical protein
VDGEQFYELGSVKNKRPLSKQSKINDIQSFSIDFDPLQARYIKILGNNMEIAPDWHHGAGLSSWIFADEVTVR